MAEVSVVIPVYNGARFLREAIDSVLGQRHPAREIVVVDDGSTDGSRAIAESYGDRIRLIAQPNGGVAAARLKGIAHTSGAFIAYHDADDIMLPERLERQHDVLAGTTEFDFVIGAEWLFRDGEPIASFDDPEARKRCLRPGPTVGTAMIRRAAFDKYGLPRAELRIGDFVEWFSRVQRLGARHAALAEPLMLRRIHANNLSRTSALDYAGLVKALRGPRDRAG